MGAGHARSRYLNRKGGDAEGRASDWSEVVTRRIDGAIQVRSNVDPTFYSLVGSGRSGRDHHGSSLLENPYIPYQYMDSYLSSTGLEKAAINRIFLILPSRKEEREILFPFRRDQEIGSSRLKKDLRVSRVGPGGSLNAFFFLLIGVISQRLAMVRKKGGTSTLGERSTTESCMLRSGRMNRSRKGIY
ncbi:hypothetical protein M0R45_002768 [Rubus argutus]|uniref:Uncharacterized protein ycf68 n=1 Tax=Rubus argutus TaxID=59490 RepID=A0AAW1VR07_RUBAR